MLLSDFDDYALVDNNCTKGGANCTNTVGSFNCTCQTRNFWNGMKCEGLFTPVLFRLREHRLRSLSYYFSLSLPLSLSPSLFLPLSLGPMLSLCHNPYYWTVCVSVFLPVSLFICTFILFVYLFFHLLENSLLALKRRNRISVSF